MSTTQSPNSSPSFAIATLGAMAHACLLLVLFALYVVYVPAAKKTFDEFGLTLPWLTLNVIRLSMWIAEYWWALAPAALVFGLADLSFLWVLSARSWRASLLGALLLSLVPVALIGATTFAIELPKAKLREALAG
jgi:type II secretory pathway component PulF